MDGAGIVAQRKLVALERRVSKLEDTLSALVLRLAWVEENMQRRPGRPRKGGVPHAVGQ